MEKKTLTPLHLRKLGTFDNAGRWYPNEQISEYFKSIRSPSRAWPYSYYKAALTQKFYRWLEQNVPGLIIN